MRDTREDRQQQFTPPPKTPLRKTRPLDGKGGININTERQSNQGLRQTALECFGFGKYPAPICLHRYITVGELRHIEPLLECVRAEATPVKTISKTTQPETPRTPPQDMAAKRRRAPDRRAPRPPHSHRHPTGTSAPWGGPSGGGPALASHAPPRPPPGGRHLIGGGEVGGDCEEGEEGDGAKGVGQRQGRGTRRLYRRERRPEGGGRGPGGW